MYIEKYKEFPETANPLRRALFCGEISPQPKITNIRMPPHRRNFHSGEWSCEIDGIPFKIYHSSLASRGIAEKEKDFENSIREFLGQQATVLTDGGQYRYSMSCRQPKEAK